MKLFVIFPVLLLMLLGLPLLGVVIAGHSLNPYLEFPPQTRHVFHAPFSWTAFVICSIVVLAMVAVPITMLARRNSRPLSEHIRGLVFPWWGWMGLITGTAGWILAWTRMSWFTPFQPHTFPLLWLSYILVINAMTYRRKGRCMMTSRPGHFFVLFPASALFWWFFEYLNRFVQNWFYVGTDFGPGEYFLYATASFSTVLPAVLGTREWLLTYPGIRKGFINLPNIRPARPRLIALAVMAASGTSLSCIGLFPNYLFPLLWATPFLLIVALQTLMGTSHIFSDLGRGDWTIVISSALAALVCGFFWEMWNYLSLAKWIYDIPFVNRFHIFEMPILGYAGYLPFGLECAVVDRLIQGFTARDS